jgi:3-oxoacyl-[acyl-carrier protein] reductase
MTKTALHGKVSLITGGGSGIGLAVARRLLAAGSAVLVTDIAPQAEVTVLALSKEREMPENAHELLAFVTANAGDPDTPFLLMEDVEKRFGGLDFLINNAGTSGVSTPVAFADIAALDDGLWSSLLNLNLVAPFRMTRAAAPLLKKRHGAVVNTASVAGMKGQASSIPYAASKAGLINLTQNLARALSPDVRVNAVAPGWIDTPWTKSWPEERRLKSIENTLLKRVGTPEDVADVMFFLAVGAAFVTGQTVVVDGGR